MAKYKVAKYKVGDRVRVRQDLWLTTYYMRGYDYTDDPNYRDAVVSEMKPFAGTVVTIKYVGTKYHIEEDDGDWWWTDDMFEGLVEDEPFTIDDLETGMFGKMWDGTIFVVVDDLLVCDEGSWMSKNDYTKDLLVKCSNRRGLRSCDIMEVKSGVKSFDQYEDGTFGSLEYRRETVKAK